MSIDIIYDIFRHTSNLPVYCKTSDEVANIYNKLNSLPYEFRFEVSDFIDESCIWRREYSVRKLKIKFAEKVQIYHAEISEFPDKFKNWSIAYNIFLKLLEINSEY